MWSDASCIDVVLRSPLNVFGCDHRYIVQLVSRVRDVVAEMASGYCNFPSQKSQVVLRSSQDS